jgi:uncharacterized surface protein with fasciclin (FAS1) repeats
MTKNKYVFLILTIGFLVFAGCKNKIDDHYDVQSNLDILQQIKSTPELSMFYSLLVKTGYDQLLIASQSFTVWAPNNVAMANLSAEVVSDTAVMKSIIANHICYLSYLFNLDTTTRVKMLSGKYITIYKQGLTVEGANLISPYDRLCRNGVLHVIDNVIVPKSNIYTVINNYPSYLQVALIDSCNKTIFDVNNSIRTGVNKVGKSVYDSVWITVNHYFTQVADLSDESAVQTYILLSNKAYNEGLALIKPYVVYTATTRPDTLAAFNMISDLAFNGKYDPKSLPDTLTSTSGVKVHIDSKDVLGSVETSNGMVIILDAYPVKIVDKIKTIIIEGENSVGRKLSSNDTTTLNHFAKRSDSRASGGYDFIYNPSSTKQTYIQYPVSGIYSVKYNFYWVAANITGLTTTPVNTYFNQTLSFNSYNSSTAIVAFGPVAVTPDYNSASLGQFTFPTFIKSASIRVLSDAVNIPNPIIVDYIKMVPVIQ